MDLSTLSDEDLNAAYEAVKARNRADEIQAQSADIESGASPAQIGAAPVPVQDNGVEQTGEQTMPEDQQKDWDEYQKSRTLDNPDDSPVKAGFRTFFNSFFGQGRKDAMDNYRRQTEGGGVTEKTLGYLSDLGNSFWSGLVGGGAKMAEAVGNVTGNEGLREGAKNFREKTLNEYLPTDMTDTAPVNPDGTERERTWGQRLAQTGKDVMGITGEFAPAAAGGIAGKVFEYGLLGAGGVNKYNDIVDFAEKNSEYNGLSKAQARAIGLGAAAFDVATNAYFMGKFRGNGVPPIEDKIFKSFLMRQLAGAAKTGVVMGGNAGVQESMQQLVDSGDLDFKKTGRVIADSAIEGALFHLMNTALHEPVRWSSAKNATDMKDAHDRLREASTAIDRERDATEQADAAERNRQTVIQAARQVLDDPQGIAMFIQRNPDLVVDIVSARRQNQNVDMALLHGDGVHSIGTIEGMKIKGVDGVGDLRHAFQTQEDANRFGDRLLQYVDDANAGGRLMEARRANDAREQGQTVDNYTRENDARASRENVDTALEKRSETLADANDYIDKTSDENGVNIRYHAFLEQYGRTDSDKTRIDFYEVENGLKDAPSVPENITRESERRANQDAQRVERMNDENRADRLVEALPEDYAEWRETYSQPDNADSRMQFLAYFNGRDFALKNVPVGGTKVDMVKNAAEARRDMEERRASQAEADYTRRSERREAAENRLSEMQRERAERVQGEADTERVDARKRDVEVALKRDELTRKRNDRIAAKREADVKAADESRVAQDDMETRDRADELKAMREADNGRDKAVLEEAKEDAELQREEQENADAQDRAAAEDAAKYDAERSDAATRFRRENSIPDYDVWRGSKTDSKAMRWAYNDMVKRAVRKAVGEGDPLARKVRAEMERNAVQGEFDFTATEPAREVRAEEAPKQKETRNAEEKGSAEKDRGEEADAEARSSSDAEAGAEAGSVEGEGRGSVRKTRTRSGEARDDAHEGASDGRAKDGNGRGDGRPDAVGKESSEPEMGTPVTFSSRRDNGTNERVNGKFLFVDDDGMAVVEIADGRMRKYPMKDVMGGTVGKAETGAAKSTMTDTPSADNSASADSTSARAADALRWFRETDGFKSYARMTESELRQHLPMLERSRNANAKEAVRRINDVLANYEAKRKAAPKEGGRYTGSDRETAMRYARRDGERATEKDIRGYAKRIEKFAPGMKVEYREFSDAEKERAGGEIGASYNADTNTVVIPKDATVEEAVHEIGWHAAFQYAKRNSPELLRKMTRFASEAPESIKREVFAKYGDFSGEALLDEVGALRYVREGMGGRIGDAIREKANRGWLRNMLDGAANVMRWAAMRNGVSMRGIKGMSPEKVIDRLASDMVGGKRLKENRAMQAVAGAVEGEMRYARRDGEDRELRELISFKPGDVSISRKEIENGYRKAGVRSGVLAQRIEALLGDDEGGRAGLGAGDAGSSRQARELAGVQGEGRTNEGTLERVLRGISAPIGKWRVDPKLGMIKSLGSFPDGEKAKSGAESTVFFDKKHGDVLKLRNLDSFEGIRLPHIPQYANDFNFFFGKFSPISIDSFGVTKYGDGVKGTPNEIIRQKYAEFKDGSWEEALEKIHKDLATRFPGMKWLGDEIAQIGNKRISDLHSDNLGIDVRTGKPFVRDCNIDSDGDTSWMSERSPMRYARREDGEMVESPRMKNADRQYMDAAERIAKARRDGRDAGKKDIDEAELAVRKAAANSMPDTKIVDEDGLPKVVYHGTPEKFNSFSEDYVSWVTPDKEYADAYTSRYGKTGGSVMRLFANAKNVFDIGNVGDKLTDERFSEIARKLGVSSERLDSVVDGHKNFDHVFDITDRMSSFLEDNGYDAIRALEESEDGKLHETFGILNNKNVKSADPVTYDDAGNVIPLSKRFDQDNNDIRYARRSARNPGDSRSVDRDEPFKDRLRRAVQDNLIDWRNYQDETGGVKDVVDANGHTDFKKSTDYYEARDRQNGYVEKDMRELQRKRDGIDEVLVDANVSSDEFGEYLALRHAEERNRAVARKNGDTFDMDYDVGAGISSNDANARLAAMMRDPAKRQALDRAGRMFDDMTRADLDRRLASGRISQEDHGRLAQYKHYAPLRRDAEDGDIGMFNASTGGMKRNEFIGAKGLGSGKLFDANGRLTVNPYEFAVMQSEEGIRGSLENESRLVLRNLIEHAARNGNDIGRVVEGEMLPKGAGYAFDLGNGDRVYADSGYNIAGNRRDVVLFKEGGKLKAMVFEAGENGRGLKLADAANGKDMAKWHKAMEWVPKATRWMAAMRTQFVPTFIARNIKADALEAVTAALGRYGVKDAAGIAKDMAKASVSNFKELKSYVKTGKATGFVKEAIDGGLLTKGGTASHGFAEMEQAIKDHRAKLERERAGFMKLGAKDKAKRVLDWAADTIGDANEIAELNTRISLYTALRNRNVPKNEAIKFCRDATTNFNRHGWLTPYINGAFMFSNAATQGMVRNIQAIKDVHGRQLVGTLIALGTAEALVNHFYGNDDDRDKAGGGNAHNLSEYEKKHQIGIPVGDGKQVIWQTRGLYATIPYLARTATDVMLGETSAYDAAMNVLSEAGDVMTEPLSGNGVSSKATAMQSVSPTLVDPLVQWVSGKDYKGDDRLARVMNSSKPLSSNGLGKTAGGYKWIAKKLNWITGGNESKKGLVDMAPEDVQLILETIWGGVGRDISQVGSGIATARQLARGEDPERVLGETAFVRDWIREYPKIGGRYYRAVQENADAKYQFDSLKTYAERKEFLREHPAANGSLKTLKDSIDVLTHRAKGQMKIRGKWVDANFSDDQKRRASEKAREQMARYVKLSEARR